jgi:mono/diheme cytochrome c family protein
MRFLAAFFVWGLLSLTLVAPVKGDCQLRSRSTYSSYSTTYYPQATYVAPVTYVAPAKYVYPVQAAQAYKQEILLVPKAIEVEVQRKHYYSIDPYAQQNLLADAIVGRLIRMNALTAPAMAAPPGMVIPQQAAPVQPIGAQPAPMMPPAADDTPRAGAYQDPKVLAVVTASCAKCHGAASKNTKLLTVDGKLNDLPAGKIWECFALVNSGEMPKASKSLDDESVKLFYAWAKNARK